MNRGKQEKMKKNKKAQHEIVGFVSIVVIVIIIGVVLLSLMIGKGEVREIGSSKISNLLIAGMYHTSDCAVSFVPQYLDVEGLLKSCYKNEKCLDKRDSCEVARSYLESVVGKNLEIEKGVNKAYKIKVYYRDYELDIEEEIIPEIKEGVFEGCNAKIGVNQPIAIGSFASGVIDVELEVCQG